MTEPEVDPLLDLVEYAAGVGARLRELRGDDDSHRISDAEAAAHVARTFRIAETVADQLGDRGAEYAAAVSDMGMMLQSVSIEMLRRGATPLNEDGRGRTVTRSKCGWCGQVADFVPHETKLAIIVCQACGEGTYLPSKAHLAAIDRAISEGRADAGVSYEDIERERERLREPPDPAEPDAGA